MSDYMDSLASSHAPQTLQRYRDAYKLFADFLAKSNEPMTSDLFSRELLESFYADLAIGRHGRPRSLDTKARILEKVEGAWAWAFEEDKPGVPKPKSKDWARDDRQPVKAPTWGEMAACVKACLSDGPRRLATILYYTGVRAEQAREMVWGQIDLARNELTVPPHKGLPGRIVPMSPHFTRALKAWGVGDPIALVTGWPVVHQLAERRLNEAWKRAGVREIVWKRAPGKAFRRGVTTGLKRVGIEREDGEMYVGRAIAGARGAYLDTGALPLEHVAAAFPSIEASKGIQ